MPLDNSKLTINLRQLTELEVDVDEKIFRWSYYGVIILRLKIFFPMSMLSLRFGKKKLTRRWGPTLPNWGCPLEDTMSKSI